MSWVSEIPEEFRQAVEDQAEALRVNCELPLRERLQKRWMPRPLWAEREMCDDPLQAQEYAMREAALSQKPFCIYLHVPYCVSRCEYCDCYAFPLTPSRRLEPKRYSELLCKEIAIWERESTLKDRPVSTVHFGGGTPLTIGLNGMERVLRSLRSSFRIGEGTEIAIESTSSILEQQALDTLRAMGLNRLHIGVQSLQDAVRERIGRHESGAAVLQKIRYALASGWIVSTDIIIGLPGYHTSHIMKDIEALVSCGVEGFSIYELVQSARNQTFFKKYGLLDQDVLEKYAQFQTAFLKLNAEGYSRSIYNHMARGRDDNRYFASPRRGEDLLPLGTIADGYFGDYLIRHTELADYRKALACGTPGLCGGMRRTPDESRQNRLEIELRSGKPDPLVFQQLLGTERAMALFSGWFQKGYLSAGADFENCELQGNGSWFIGEMIEETGAAS